MSEIEVTDIEDITPNKRISPATRMLNEIEGDYLSVGQIAERYGVHPETIRRLIKATNKDGSPKLKAPSKAARQGGLIIYLFTTEDVAEMDAYMKNKGRAVKNEK